jgi:hypothetical protein
MLQRICRANMPDKSKKVFLLHLRSAAVSLAGAHDKGALTYRSRAPGALRVGHDARRMASQS